MNVGGLSRARLINVLECDGDCSNVIKISQKSNLIWGDPALKSPYNRVGNRTPLAFRFTESCFHWKIIKSKLSITPFTTLFAH